jgi:hypothetical protein
VLTSLLLSSGKCGSIAARETMDYSLHLVNKKPAT